MGNDPPRPFFPQAPVIRKILDHIDRRFDRLVLPSRAPPLFPESSPPPVIRNPLRMHRPNRGFGRGESSRRVKFSPVLPINVLSKSRDSGGKTLLHRRQRKNICRGENRSEKTTWR